MAREVYILLDEHFPDKREISVSGEEAHHLIKVLRAGSGYRFIGFDGKGNGWRAEVTSVSKGQVSARIIEPIEKSYSVACEFTVCVGIIKGNRMDWAIEKAAELGAVRFVPLLTRYSVVSPGDGRIKRWKTVALSAAKQSHRFRLMDVCAPMRVEESIQGEQSSKETTRQYPKSAVRSPHLTDNKLETNELSCQPRRVDNDNLYRQTDSKVGMSASTSATQGQERPCSLDAMCVLDVGTGSVSLSSVWADLNRQSAVDRFTLYIGPEGGFSDEELSLFKSHNVPVASIGLNPLRTETAVAVALGLLTNLSL